MKPGGIFISYRRGASGSVVDRINDYLVREFGPDAVFMDIDSVGYGDEFPEAIRTSLDKSKTVLAIIGPEWMEPREPGGPRSPSKWVQMEIESALARRATGMVVIPVLVGDASLPREEDLPPSLKLLPSLNAAKVRQGRDFRNDMDLLVHELPAATKRLQLKTGNGRRTGILIGAGVAGLAVLGAAFMWPKPGPAAPAQEVAAIEPQAAPDNAPSKEPDGPAAAPPVETQPSSPSAQATPDKPAQLAPPPAPATQPSSPPPAAAQLKPRLTAAFSNAIVSATNHHDNLSMSVLKLQLAITNTSSADVSVMLYTYDDKNVGFVFSGGGSMKPNSYSKLTLDTCSQSRPVKCRIGFTWTPIAAGETLTIPFEIRSSIMAPFDQRSKLTSGTLSFNLLVNTGAGEDAVLPVNASGPVDSSNY